MGARSLLAMGSALALVAGQTAGLPEVSATAAQSCGGCYLVADVAGIVFGGVLTTTQTNVVGPNGTVVTVQQGSGKATFVTNAAVTGALPTSFNSFGPTITVAGATLTSPTGYEVFSAYSVTRTTQGADGSCTVVPGPQVRLPTASRYPVAANAGPEALLAAESSFINEVGFPECSAGGGNVASTIHSMLSTTTTQITTTAFNRPTPVAISTAASSTPAPSLAFPTTVVLSNATASGPSATFTINPALGAAARPAVPAWAAGAAAALLWWL